MEFLMYLRDIFQNDWDNSISRLGPRNISFFGIGKDVTENAERQIRHYCTPWSKCMSKPNVEN